MRSYSLASMLLTATIAACGGEPTDDEPTNSLLKTQVLCRTCPPALLASATDDVLQVMSDFVDFAGADMRDIEHHTYQPVIHLDEDDVCDPNDPHVEDGNTYIQHSRHYCLFMNRAWLQGTDGPFNENSVIPSDVMRDQAFNIALASWFDNRFNYPSNWHSIGWAARLTLLDGVADVCNPVQRDWMGFIPALCELGLEPPMIPAIFKDLAELAERMDKETGFLPGHQDFIELVSRILGTDATPAFEKAQIPDY